MIHFFLNSFSSLLITFFKWLKVLKLSLYTVIVRVPSHRLRGTSVANIECFICVPDGNMDDQELIEPQNRVSLLKGNKTHFSTLLFTTYFYFPFPTLFCYSVFNKYTHTHTHTIICSSASINELFTLLLFLYRWVASGRSGAGRHGAGHQPPPQRTTGSTGISQHWQAEMSGATR